MSLVKRLKIEDIIKHIYQVFPEELCNRILVSYFIYPAAPLSAIIYTIAEEIFNGDKVKAKEIVEETLKHIGASIIDGKIDLNENALRALWTLRLLPAIPMAVFSEKTIIRYTYPLIREGKELIPESLALMNQQEMYKYVSSLLEFLYNLIENSSLYLSLSGALFITQVLAMFCESLVLCNTRRAYTLYPKERKVDNVIDGRYVKEYEWGILYIKTRDELKEEDSLCYYYNPSRKRGYFRGRVHLVNKRIIVILPKKGKRGEISIEIIGPLPPMPKTKVGAMINISREKAETLSKYLWRCGRGTCKVNIYADVFIDKEYIYVIVPQVQ